MITIPAKRKSARKKKSEKKVILNIAHSIYHFGWGDLDMLREKYEVRDHLYNSFSDFIIKIPKMVYQMSKADMIYIWFANPISFTSLVFAKILGKKSGLVGGGYDVVKMKDIDYGVHLSKFKRIPSVLAFRMVDQIYLFSQHSKDELKKNVGLDKGDVVYLCGDTEFYKPGKEKKKRVAVTLGAISRSNLLRKGQKTFVQAAKYAPDVEFWLIGISQDDSKAYLQSIATPNVKFLDFGFDKKKILKKLQEAKVYAQVSGHEGFGVSTAEGMLCACVPVVTRRGATPELVGVTGLYVPFRDAKKTAEAIKKAMDMDGMPARKQALKFNTTARKRKLLKLVGGLLDK